MAPLNLPPPDLNIEQAQELSEAMARDDLFVGQSFKGSALDDFLQRTGKLSSYGNKTTLQIGQALMEHRLLHHVSDDEDFSLTGWFRLISQESKTVREYHATFDGYMANALVSGKILMETSRMFGLLKTFEPVFGILNKEKLRIFKRKSAASAPLHEFDVSKMSQVKECIDCKADWYCFTIKMKNASTVTLCADHSKRQEAWMSSLTELGLDYVHVYDEGAVEAQVQNLNSIYELSARRLNSKDVVPLSAFKGDVCMVVNVSTLCGLTPQYKELQTLAAKYQDKGLRILGFPVNQFGNQEPGTEAEIAEFASSKYGVTFDLFEKTDCNGANAHPVFRFVKGKLSGVFGSSVKWNFTKFLCDRNGVPVKRYAPTTTPLSFEDDILELLNQPKPQ